MIKTQINVHIFLGKMFMNVTTKPVYMQFTAHKAPTHSGGSGRGGGYLLLHHLLTNCPPDRCAIVQFAPLKHMHLCPWILLDLPLYTLIAVLLAAGSSLRLAHNVEACTIVQVVGSTTSPSFVYVSNPVPDSSLCRAAAPRLCPLQLLLPDCIDRLQLLLPVCVRFDCCSLIATPKLFWKIPTHALAQCSRRFFVEFEVQQIEVRKSHITSLVPPHKHPTSVTHTRTLNLNTLITNHVSLLAQKRVGSSLSFAMLGSQQTMWESLACSND